MISFILSCANDKYCNNNDDVSLEGIEDFNTERLLTTLKGLSHLGIPYEVNVVEFQTLKYPLYSTFIKDPNVNFYTFPLHIKEDLYKQTPYRMPIYEALGKHIGSLFAKYDKLFFMNNDDIFRKDGILDTIKDVDCGNVCRAIRYSIDPNIVKDYGLVKRIVDGEMIDGFAMSPNAGGDYLCISKENYKKSGGFRLCHGEWDTDNEYLQRCKDIGLDIIQRDYHYHITHYNTKDQHCMTPNRPPRVSGKEHQLIDDVDSIINRVLRYNIKD